MQIIWKPIKGYEGFYEVSNKGEVRNSNTLKILKPRINNSGYCRVGLRKDFKTKEFLVHRLVAMAFIKPIDGKELVNHIDENKINNVVENLEWVTHLENIHHGTCIERMGRPESTKKVFQFTKFGVFVTSYKNLKHASQELEIPYHSLYANVVNHHTLNTDFILMFEEDVDDFKFKNSNTLIDVLESKRIEMKMTKSELQEHLGVTTSNYNIWNRKKFIPYKYLKEISILLKITLDEAWDLNENKQGNDVA
ncbi:NUMOD4 domain-containing protein [Streptococcus pluranimalium]|uniref:NUMOD4 domain-containing protein n=1 Tax=Streptococcus pluranimalium TaxID=82348 RepID=UPI003F67BBFA